MGKWQSESIKLFFRGLDLIHPVDQVPADWWSRFTNLEARQEGSIQMRPGLTRRNAVAFSDVNVQAVKRLVNLADNTQLDLRIIKASNAIWTALVDSPFTGTQRDTGWSTFPPFMVPWRPLLDENSWMYVTDQNRSRRIDITGTVRQVGISRPGRQGVNTELAHIRPITVGDPTTFMIYNLTTANDATARVDWETQGFIVRGVAGAIQTRKKTRSALAGTVNAVQGYLVSAPAAGTTSIVQFGRINSADLLRQGTTAFGDKSRIEMFLGVGRPDHIDEIRLTFSLSTASPIQAAAAGITQSGTLIQVNTTAAHGYVTGDTVVIQGTNRPEAEGVWGIIVIDSDSFTLTDSVFSSTGGGGNALNFSQNHYYQSIMSSTVVDRIAYESSPEGIQQEKDAALRSAYNRYVDDWWANYDPSWDHFYHDYFLDDYYEEEPMSFADWKRNYGESSIFELDSPVGLPSKLPLIGQIGEGASGSAQHFVFSTTRGNFNRVGSDSTLDWSNTSGIIVSFVFNDDAEGGALDGNNTGDFVAFAELDIADSRGALDSSKGDPYKYRYTYYDSLAGVESNPSPPMPEGVRVYNQAVTVTVEGVATTIADRIRIYRRGGSAARKYYHYVGEVNNPGAGNTATYVDIMDNLDVSTAPLLNINNFRPLPLPVDVTNNLLFSNRFDGSSWTLTSANVSPNAAFAPGEFGGKTMSAWEMEATGANGELNQTTVSITETWYFSIYLKAKEVTGTTGHVRLYYTDSGGTDQPAGGGQLVDLDEPNFDTDKGGFTGIWQRFVLAVPATATDVGIKIVNSGDRIFVFGAMLESWDADTGFIPPARYLSTEDTRQAQVTREVQNVPGTDIYGRQQKDFLVTDDASARQIEILEDGASPEQWWGPFEGKYIFAIRGRKDHLGAGTDVIWSSEVFWCDPQNPDVWPAQNHMPVTGEGEPLIRGFIYNGRSFVFSTETLYILHPNPTGLTAFVPITLPVGVGILNPYCLATGPKIWWLGKEGIYESTGGREVNITDATHVRPLFKGETVNGVAAADFTAADRLFDMFYADPHLYFTYPQVGGGRRTLRYHTGLKRWELWSRGNLNFGIWENETRNILWGDQGGRLQLQDQTGVTDDGATITCTGRTGALDQKQPTTTKLYGDITVEANIPSGQTATIQAFLDDEETALSASTLTGTGSRTRYQVDIGDDRRGRSISFEIVFSVAAGETSPVFHEINVDFQLEPEAKILWDSDYENDGDLNDKWIAGLYIEYAIAGASPANDKTIQILIDGTAVSGTFTVAATNGARGIAKISLDPPQRGVEMRFRATDSNSGQLFNWRWLFKPEPDQLLEPFAWTNLDWPYEKFVKGFAIEADTFGASVVLELRSDGDETTNPLGVQTFTLIHTGPSIAVFDFDNSGTGQLLLESVRLTNTSANSLRVYKIQWIYDQEPPNTRTWRTQEKTFNSPAWQHVRDMYISIRCGATVNVVATVDGTALTTQTITSTSGNRRKERVVLPAHKGKVYQFTLTSAVAFKVYNEDTEIFVKPWNSQEPYKQFQIPFEGGVQNP